MSVHKHKHGKTSEEAKKKVKAFLKSEGYDEHISWNGDEFSASVGFSVVLSLKGKITETEIIIQDCSGVAGGKVLDKCKMLFEREL